jgi:hypothetical protein
MKTLIGRIRVKAGYGWTCPPCKINAGHPDDPFPTDQDAAAGLAEHVRATHDGIGPDGAQVDEISWR